MPSFDIVSEVEATEVKNAVDNSNREIDTRFDFRGVEASFELKDMVVTVKSESDYQVKQLIDILRGQCVKRQVDPNSMDTSANYNHSGKTVSKAISFRQGIEQDLSKKIVKLIKDGKYKVQASIQGDKVRVTGKKRDDLQQVMQMLRQAELDQPLQFNNFRD